jgi:hypothetical protein
MTHITVPDQNPFIEFAVTSSDDTFDFEFTYFDPTDLRVVIGGVELDQDEFEVIGTAGYEGGYPGGTVTLDTPAENTTVRISSQIPPVRINDFLEGAGLPARAVNTELDKATARLRDMRLLQQRIPVVSFGLAHSLVSTDAGQLFTNEGLGALAYTLPASSAGLRYSFAVVQTATLSVAAVGGDAIKDGSSSGVTFSAAVIGCIAEIVGTDDGLWLVRSKNGTWSLA